MRVYVAPNVFILWMDDMAERMSLGKWPVFFVCWTLTKGAVDLQRV